jgi:hypothetical protein
MGGLRHVNSKLAARQSSRRDVVRRSPAACRRRKRKGGSLMKRFWSCLTSVLALLLMVSGARAVEPAAENGSLQTGQTGSVDLMTMSGVVVSSSSTQLVIRTDAGVEETFVVDSYSDVPANLAAGTKVTVKSRVLADGRNQVARVTTGGTGADTPAVTGGTWTGTTDPPAKELPRTASPLFLVGLAGLMALGGGLGLRLMFRSR